MECHYATIWESLADTIGDREAVVCGDIRRTWGEYENRASRLAQAFAHDVARRIFRVWCCDVRNKILQGLGCLPGDSRRSAFVESAGVL